MPDYIDIRTNQNVEITYKLGGLGNRVLAKVIDIVIMTGFGLVTFFIVDSLGISGWIISFFFLPLMLYSLLFETLNNGQTPGKNITKIKVVSMDGSPLSVAQVLIRWLLQPIDTWALSGLPGLISIGSGDTQQRLGDRSAGTIVVSLKNDTELKQTAYVKVENNYEPKYLQASQLTTKDIKILKSVLHDRSDNRFKTITKAAQKIKKLLDIQTSQPSEDFLETIIKDYNYYQQDIKNDQANDYSY